MSSSMRYRDRRQQKEDAPIQFERAVTGLWIILMFVVFPLIVHDAYFDLLETKFKTFVVLTTAMFCVIVFWGIASGRAGNYIGKIKEKGFKNWFLSTFDITDRCMMVFIGIAGISTLTAYPYIKEAFFGNLGRSTGFELLLMYAMAFFIVSRYLNVQKYYFKIFLVVGDLICLFGMTDYLNMDIMKFKKRMMAGEISMFASTIGNINTYTTYVAYVVALAGVLFILTRINSEEGKEGESIGNVIFYYISMVIGFIALAMGNSDNGYLTLLAFFGFVPFVAFKTRRGIRRYILTLATYFTGIEVINWINKANPTKVLGINGLYNVIANFKFLIPLTLILWVIGMILCVMDYKKNRQDENAKAIATKIWLVIVVIVAILGVAVVIYANANPEKAAAFGGLRDYLVFSDSWGTFRGYVWRMCLEEYAKYPILHKIFGTGPDTFVIYALKYRAEDMIAITGQKFDSVHNEYLQYLTTIGPIALIAYIGILVTTIKKGISFINEMKNQALAPYIVASAFLVLCYAVQATVNINLPISTPVMWIFMMMIAAANREKKVME